MCMGLLGFQILRPNCTSPGHFHTTVVPPPTMGVSTQFVCVSVSVCVVGGGEGCSSMKVTRG